MGVEEYLYQQLKTLKRSSEEVTQEPTLSLLKPSQLTQISKSNMISILSQAKDCQVDATSKVLHILFTQLSSIHAFIKSGENVKQLSLFIWHVWWTKTQLHKVIKLLRFPKSCQTQMLLLLVSGYVVESAGTWPTKSIHIWWTKSCICSLTFVTTIYPICAYWDLSSKGFKKRLQSNHCKNLPPTLQHGLRVHCCLLYYNQYISEIHKR